MRVEDLFSLLRLGLEIEGPSEAVAQSFVNLTKEDWQVLRAMADKQGVSAIVFDGLNALISSFGTERVVPDIDKSWWRQFVLEWTSLVMTVEQRNGKQLQVMEDMARLWAAQGCRVMVMKGQACGTFYPKPEHRSPGDIDCYLVKVTGESLEVMEGYAIGNEIAKEAGAEVDDGWYKHSQISYKGETFENHQYFVHTREGKRSKRLNEELVKVIGESLEFRELTESTVIPPVQWNAMFLTYHACAHFLSEGLRLKQLLDWAMFLQKHQDDVDWPRFYDFCQRYHLRRFADAATAICVKNMGIKITNPTITTTSPYAERILQSALYDDDYVFGSGEGSWHNRWHLVRNLFHYRWKYEEIYEETVWRQLWYYASGYLFKTE